MLSYRATLAAAALCLSTALNEVSLAAQWAGALLCCAPQMQGRQHELRGLEGGAAGPEGLAGEAVRPPRSVSRRLCLLGSQAVDRVLQNDVPSRQVELRGG